MRRSHESPRRDHGTMTIRSFWSRPQLTNTKHFLRRWKLMTCTIVLRLPCDSVDFRVEVSRIRKSRPRFRKRQPPRIKEPPQSIAPREAQDKAEADRPLAAGRDLPQLGSQSARRCRSHTCRASRRSSAFFPPCVLCDLCESRSYTRKKESGTPKLLPGG